jgi:hypothetical protein
LVTLRGRPTVFGCFRAFKTPELTQLFAFGILFRHLRDFVFSFRFRIYPQVASNTQVRHNFRFRFRFRFHFRFSVFDFQFQFLLEISLKGILSPFQPISSTSSGVPILCPWHGLLVIKEYQCTSLVALDFTPDTSAPPRLCHVSLVAQSEGQ